MRNTIFHWSGADGLWLFVILHLSLFLSIGERGIVLRCAIDLFQRLANCLFDSSIIVLLFVHVVEGNLVASLREQMLIEPISLAHQPPQMIAIHGVLEERFGCPNQNLIGDR